MGGLISEADKYNPGTYPKMLRAADVW